MSSANVHQTKKSSRLGERMYKVPPPTRFKTVKDATTYIKANKLKVTEHHTHTRGVRIQVVDTNGKARTLSVDIRSKKEKKDAE